MSDEDKKPGNIPEDDSGDKTIETIALTAPESEAQSESETAPSDSSKPGDDSSGDNSSGEKNSNDKNPNDKSLEGKSLEDKGPDAKNPTPESPRANASDKRAKAKESHPPARKRSWLSIVLLLLFLCLAFVVAYVIYFGQQTLSAQSQKISAVESSISQGNNALQQNLVALSQTQQSAIEKLNGDLRNTRRTVDEMSQRILAQGKRLNAMTDTSRNDWLLAEAEYLLKLANQRVRIERSPVGAQALLEEADNILRDLDEPSLYPARRAIAKDLAALKLLNKIDVEGIYLALLALTDQANTIPIRVAPSKREMAEQQNAVAQTNERSFWQTVSESWQGFTQSFKDYVRVVHHDEKPKALLPVQDEVYLQQNLRLMLERAQLALLREQQDIYTTSLAQADQWLQEYYNTSEKLDKFRQALAALQEKTIVQDLPDISQSLELLHQYISDLHQLAARQVPASKAPVKNVPSTKTSAKKSPSPSANAPNAEASQ